jgi:hypothetical protein
LRRCVAWGRHGLRRSRRLGVFVLDLGRLDAVCDRVEILIRPAKPLEDSYKGVAIGWIRFGPARRKLDPGDGIVTAADTDALRAPAGSPIGAVATVMAAGVVTCTHDDQL